MDNYTLNAALDLFLLDCRSRRLTASTLAFYRNKCRRFLAYLAEEHKVTQVSDVTSSHVREYLIYLAEQGMTDHSQHDYARAAKALLNYCVRDEILPQSPWVRVGMPTVGEHLPVVLTDEEVKHLLATVKHLRNRTMAAFILDSGVRGAELLALDVSDVDLATGSVTVRQGKQQKDRVTSIGPTTRKDLRRYLIGRQATDAEPLFTTERQPCRRLKQHSLISIFRKMREETGIEDLTPHTLRRTMATMLLERGVDSFVLQRMLGHASIEQLKRYAAVSGGTIQRTVDEYSVVDRMTESKKRT